MTPTLALEDATCPGCDAAGGAVVYEAEDFIYQVAPGPFPLVRCGGCDLVYLGRRPTRQAIAQAYPAHYLWRLADVTPHGPGLDAAVAAWWFRQVYRRRAAFVAPLLPAPAPLLPAPAPLLPAPAPWLPKAAPRVLELGCGTGHFLGALAAARPDGTYVGMDFEVGAAPPGVRLIAGDVEEARLDEPPFDVVCLWHVLEHLHGPRRALAAAYERLAPGGWLVVGTQNFDALSRHLTGPRWPLNDAPRHLMHFTPATLRPLVAQAGFVDARVHHRTEMFPALGGFLFPEAAMHADGRLAALPGVALAAAFAPLELAAIAAGRACIFNLVARKPA